MLDIEPLTPETSVPWARLTREYLARREIPLLHAAISEAQQSGEMDVVALLQYFRNQDHQQVEALSITLVSAFYSAGRKEEALTVGIISFDSSAEIARQFTQYPFEEQMEALSSGLYTCRQVMAFARALGDYACQAYYLVGQGLGYAGARFLIEAEKAYEEALEIYRALAEQQPEIYTLYVARILNNLGNVWTRLNRLDKADTTLEEALAKYRALAEKEPEVYASDVVRSLITLGGVLFMLSELAEARAAYEEALKITRERDLVVERSKVLPLLTELAILENRWNEGEQLSQEAIAQVERLRTEEQNLSRRGQVLREHVTVYEQLLVCLLKQGEKERAFVVTEQGKSRSINDLLAARELRPKDERLAQERDELLVKVRALEDLESFLGMQSQDTNLTGEQEKALRHRLESLRHERVRSTEELEKLGRKIQQAEPDFLPYAPTLSFDEIKEVAHSATATLLLFRVTDYGSFIFLAFPDGETDVVEVSAFNAGTLSEMLVKLENDKPVSGWSWLYYRRQTDQWMEFMEAMLNRLYSELIKPVHQRLREKRRHMNGSKRLVIVPNRGLAILPLHACSWKENGEIKYLLDEYVCAYAPSLYILKRSLSRKRELEPQDR
jgi:tetratricopeptide (TPR) repeat protein